MFMIKIMHRNVKKNNIEVLSLFHKDLQLNFEKL